MGKGRYIKAAERACARKARFETAAAAEAFAEYRFRAYLCPVCHDYHLTSNGKAVTEPEPPKPPEKGPKLADLDWSAALDPQEEKPKRTRKPKPAKPSLPPRPVGKPAECRSRVGKDGRALLVVEGRLVKSARIRDPFLIAKLAEGVKVVVEDGPHPTVLSIVR